MQMGSSVEKHKNPSESEEPEGRDRLSVLLCPTDEWNKFYSRSFILTRKYIQSQIKHRKPDRKQSDRVILEEQEEHQQLSQLQI